MAQVLIRYCDQHQTADENVEGAQWELTITPPGEKTVGFDVDLCPDCSKPLRDLIEHFDDIARTLKRPAGKAPAANGQAAELDDQDVHVCPFPDCGHPAPTRSALGSHARLMHKMRLSQLLGEKPQFVCLVCDDRPPFAKGQGFAAHRRAAHSLGPDDPLIPGEVLADPEATSIKYSETANKSRARRDATAA